MSFSGQMKLLFAVPVIFFSGCGMLDTGEPLGQSVKVDVATKIENCRKGSLDKLSNYLEGNYRERPEVISNLFRDCSKTLDLFMSHVQGKTKGQYSKEELRHFLNFYFFTPDSQINQEIVDEFFELKKSFLGGSSRILTFSELRSAQHVMESLRKEAVELNDYLPLTSEAARSRKSADFIPAVRQFEKVSDSIGKIFSQWKEDYSFERFTNLLKQLEVNLGPEANTFQIRRLRQNIGFFASMKAMLMGSTEGNWQDDIEGIRTDEWPKLLSMNAKVYSLFLRFGHFRHQMTQCFGGQALSFCRETSNLAFDLMEEAASTHQDSTVPLELFNRLVSAIKDPTIPDDDKLFVTSAQEQTFEQFWPRLFKGFFGGLQPGPQGRDARGLTLGGIRRTRQAFERWGLVQEYAQNTYLSLYGQGTDSSWLNDSTSPLYQSSGFTKDEIMSVVKTKRVEPEVPFVSVPGIEQSPDSPVGTYFGELVDRFRPFFKGWDSEFYFPKYGETPKYSFYNFSMLNWIRELSHSVLLGYIDDPNRWIGIGIEPAERGILKDELDRFYKTYYYLGRELHYLDSDSENEAKNRFEEGNLFTYAADGNEVLNRLEGIEVLGYMLSARSKANRIHFDIADSKNGCVKGPFNNLGWPDVEINCFKKTFFGEFPKLFSHLPNFVNYYVGLKDDEKKTFQDNLMKTALGEKFGKALYVTGGDTERLATIPQYVESLFQKFDTNQNKILDFDEICERVCNVSEKTGAYAVIYPTIKRIYEKKRGEESTPDDILSVFFWLLEGRDFPKGITGLLEYSGWSQDFLEQMSNQHKYDIQSVDRGRVVQIFGLLSL